MKGLVRVKITLLIISSICFGQTGAGGSASPLGAGGKAEGAFTAKLTTAINKKVFSKLANASQNSAGKSKKTPIRQNRPQSVAKNSTKTKTPTAPKNSQSDTQTSQNSVFNFRPVGNTGVDKSLVELMTNKPEEQQIFQLIFSETKKAYQAEATKLGRQNDLALSLTFFIATCVTVYHDAPEPSDLATDNLYLMLAESMVETPEIAKMSNQEKNITSDTLIYISGLILAGYMSSKENNDAETLAIYQKTAGECLQSLMGISPDNIYFEGNDLKINQ